MNTTCLAWLNTPEIIALLVVVLILFGAKKLPELARGLGRGIKEFKKASREVTDEIQSVMDDDAPPPQQKKLPEKRPETEAARTVPQSGADVPKS